MSAWEVAGWVVVAGCIFVSAVLASIETAITHVRRSRILALAQHPSEGDEPDGDQQERLDTLLGVLDQRRRYLAPVLLLSVISRVGGAAMLAVLAYRRFDNGGAWLAVAGLAIIVFVLAEALPKGWALRHTETHALRVVHRVRLLDRLWIVRWPARGLTAVAERLMPRRRDDGDPTVSEEELLAVADRALAAHAIDEEEHELIESVIAFGDTLVREIMVPRPDMVVMDAAAGIDEAVAVAVASGHSRIPVTGAGVDDLVGVVHVKDLLRVQQGACDQTTVADLARPPRCVPETKPADDLLRDMQAGRFHLAVVVDEYGGTAGLVTMEDLIEEVVGEIVDEFDDEEPMAQPLAGGGLRVHGRMPVDELNALLESDLPDGDWDTVGGLIFDALGHVPDVGERVEVGGHWFSIEQVEGRRITRIRVGDGERS